MYVHLLCIAPASTSRQSETHRRCTRMLSYQTYVDPRARRRFLGLLGAEWKLFTTMLTHMSGPERYRTALPTVCTRSRGRPQTSSPRYRSPRRLVGPRRTRRRGVLWVGPATPKCNLDRHCRTSSSVPLCQQLLCITTVVPGQSFYPEA